MSSFELIQADPTVRMPAGTYVVGDPCYAVPDERWMEWLAAGDPTVFGPNPTRTDGGVSRVIVAELDGHPVLGIGTSFGDGAYRGSDGNTYPVDAGMIGLVPIEIAEDIRHDLSTTVHFDKPFTCSYEAGTIVLGHISIDTDPDEEEDDYCETCGDSDCNGWDCQDDEEDK